MDRRQLVPRVPRELIRLGGWAIAHRDLKPANVKVKADGSVKVLDSTETATEGDLWIAELTPAAAKR